MSAGRGGYPCRHLRFDGWRQFPGATVLRPLDKVQLTRAEYTLRSARLRIEATSTNAATTLSVWNRATGTLIRTLSQAGGGKYTGTVSQNWNSSRSLS